MAKQPNEKIMEEADSRFAEAVKKAAQEELRRRKEEAMTVHATEAGQELEEASDVLKEALEESSVLEEETDVGSDAEQEDLLDSKEESMEDAEAEKTVNKDGSKKKAGTLFKKKEKKDKKDEKIEELNDRLIRSMAEFDNFRKRTEKEKAQMFEIGAKSIIEKILPVLDNFERGLEVLTEEEKKEPFALGIEKIYKQMVTTLEEVGVAPIEAVGKEFDPNFHNAVMHEENEAFGDNTISQELQKGYLYRDTVVRYSMVKVAN